MHKNGYRIREEYNHYHPYAEDGQKSKAEYGISGVKKYSGLKDEFCINTQKTFWVADEEKFNAITAKK